MDLLPGNVRMVPHEITDAMILEHKAGYRALILTELQNLLAECEDHRRDDDPRWAKIRLDTIDRIMRLLRLVEPGPRGEELEPGLGADRARVVDRVNADLDALAARMRPAQ